MSTYPGTYIETESLGIGRYDQIIDVLLTPRLIAFRQTYVYDEPSSLQPDKVTWKQSYGIWNSTFSFAFTKNGSEVISPVSVNYEMGEFQAGVVEEGDNFACTYNFDYFPAIILKGYLDTVINIINTGSYGPPTQYTITTMPAWWDGVVADLAVAMCMERLITDYTIWRGRLIFAISGNQLEDGSGDIVGHLETIKNNAEERAYKTMDNEKFKVGNCLSYPTSVYFNAIRGVGRGGRGYGKTRGWRPNKVM